MTLCGKDGTFALLHRGVARNRNGLGCKGFILDMAISRTGYGSQSQYCLFLTVARGYTYALPISGAPLLSAMLALYSAQLEVVFNDKKAKLLL
jgi:hypothetical protein